MLKAILSLRHFSQCTSIVGATKDSETQQTIVSGLRSVSMTSSKLLMSTKTMMADPNAPNSKNLLAQAARLVCKKAIAPAVYIFQFSVDHP